MMKRNLEFESIVGKDETGKAKLELGTDHLNGMRFTIQYPSAGKLVSLFSIVDYFTMMKTAPYERLLIDYKDWYANEIIRRVTKDSSHFDKQSDAKKEVLTELVQRRNKLMKQINKAMTFYDNNKSKIDEMQKIRAKQQKFYPGPMVTYTGQNLIFENVTEYSDIFYQLTINLPDTKEEDQVGFGWMEYSKAFSETFSDLRYLTENEVVITNSKPRSDMRVMRRSDQTPSHMMDLDTSYYEFFKASAPILSLYDAGVGSTISLDRSQIFTIVDLIKHQLPENSTITMIISSDKSSKFQVKIEQDIIHLSISEETQFSISLSVNTSVFLSLHSVIHLIELVSITKLGYNLGVVFDINLGQDQLRIINNSNISSETSYLRKVLWNYLESNSLNESVQLSPDIFDGVTQKGLDNSFYTREIKKYDSDISYREKKAHIIVQEMYDYLDCNTDNILFEGKETMSTIVIDDGHPVEWQCNCRNVNEYFKCEHLLACLIFGYKEGLLFA